MKYFTMILVFMSFAVVANNAIAESMINYPYYASRQRTDQIKDNYRRIRLGAPLQQVMVIMGAPDETSPLYEPKTYKPKQIGHNHWYLIQRKAEKGSVVEKDEKLVRICYDLNWKVIHVDHWGFDEEQR